jgi:hypothetical protein
MKSKIFKTLALASVLAGVMTAGAYAESIGGATVNASGVNFRTEPDTGSAVLTRISKDTQLVVGENLNNGWYKVVCLGTVGYMSSQYLNFEEAVEGDFGMGTIYGSGVLIRDGASIGANPIATYENGTEMIVLGVFGSWYKVSLDETIGYVHSNNFALNGGVAELLEPTSEQLGQLIVDTAKKYLGTPYVWAGTSPSGFDCSGFVHYVYEECGYAINRTAASIYNNGVYVDKSELQVGDAICFGSSSNYIGHVGIYIGDGQFIHASSGSGKVIITDLDTTYYVNRYVGARRIV